MSAVGHSRARNIRFGVLIVSDATTLILSDAQHPVRHPEIVAVGRHYGMTVHTCVPYDPESKGGSEATVRVAKADLVPTEVNGRVPRETCAVPAQRLEAERARLHRLPDVPHTAALGTTRVVNTDQTVRFGSVRYSVPPGL